MKSPRYVACDLHSAVPWPLKCTCWRQLQRSEEIVKNLELRLSMPFSSLILLNKYMLHIIAIATTLFPTHILLALMSAITQMLNTVLWTFEKDFTQSTEKLGSLK